MTGDNIATDCNHEMLVLLDVQEILGVLHDVSFGYRIVIQNGGARQENRRYSPRVETCADYTGRSPVNGRANEGNGYATWL